MTYIVALTGGICSGKSTIANIFAGLGVPLVDADIIARQVIQSDASILNKIIAHYGHSILLSNGSLNRKKLRQKIFSKQRERTWLNSLLHPLIRRETKLRISLVKKSYVLWIVPLLFENSLHNKANRILLIDVIPEIQLTRVIARDGITYEQAEQILASQASREQRLIYSNDVIINNGELTTINESITFLHKLYLKLAIIFQQKTN
ncbi:dephospho-CoA kinase [Candidatus Fukatsuia anoeciicola]|uniref:dephospho-CoA kinase n=1 Tax=Candidatus Fukatsuia anoeciicola TaxID=2994492 RepID=UPI003463BF71